MIIIKTIKSITFFTAIHPIYVMRGLLTHSAHLERVDHYSILIIQQEIE